MKGIESPSQASLYTLAKASCHPGTISQDYGYICAAGNDVTAQAESVQISAGWCETSPEPPQPSNPGAAPAPVVAMPGFPGNNTPLMPRPITPHQPIETLPISPAQPGCKKDLCFHFAELDTELQCSYDCVDANGNRYNKFIKRPADGICKQQITNP